MRTLTFVQTPGEVSAVASIGAHEVVTPLPPGPEATPGFSEFLRAGETNAVSVWFVVNDVAGPARLGAWETEAGRQALRDVAPRLLCRRVETIDRLRELAPAATLAIGPWPNAGLPDDGRILRERGVRRVWAPGWKGAEEARRLIDRARSADLEIVLPLPQAWQIRKWEADPAVRDALFPVFDGEGTSWALSVGASLPFADRCGELMELATILCTKPVYKEDDRTAARDGTADPFPYRQSEGFPLLYAENLRHPPAITPTPAEARERLRLDGPVAWPWAPPVVWLYIHVPFCTRRCRFCFCASLGVRGRAAQELVRGFEEAICDEMSMWAESDLLRGRKVHTVYLGGGSPSALKPRQLHRIITHARDAFDLVDDPVMSVEMAPSSVTPSRFAAAREAGANRVSFGVQSFNDVTLARIGSAHNRAKVLLAVRRAHDAGFSDIDFDLMYGVPGQSVDDVEADVREAIDLGVKSVMLFPLHVAPDLLAWWAEQGLDCRAWSAARYHEFWERADRTFNANGFERFGYSHYKRRFDEGAGEGAGGGASATDAAQRRGRYSRYLYVMPGTDGQIAIGPTALGCAAHRQYENLCGVGEYVEAVRAGHLPVGRYTEPPGPRASLVWLLLERSAVPGDVYLDEFEERYGEEGVALVHELVQPMIPRGLFEAIDGGYRMTRTGAMWMGNVQYEIMRRAALPAPLGHIIWE